MPGGDGIPLLVFGAAEDDLFVVVAAEELSKAGGGLGAI
jgi:hypothetical protein